MNRFRRFMAGSYPSNIDKRLNVSIADLKAALEPLEQYLGKAVGQRNTVAHPSNDMKHFLQWDLDRIAARGSLGDIALHRTLVECAKSHPYGHRAGQHSARVEEVEREKRAPPVFYVEDSDEEDIREIVESAPMRRSAPVSEASSLEEGEIDERKRKGKGKRGMKRKAPTVSSKEDEGASESDRERRVGPTCATAGAGGESIENRTLPQAEQQSERIERETEDGLHMSDRPQKRLRR